MKSHVYLLIHLLECFTPSLHPSSPLHSGWPRSVFKLRLGWHLVGTQLPWHPQNGPECSRQQMGSYPADCDQLTSVTHTPCQPNEYSFHRVLFTLFNQHSDYCYSLFVMILGSYLNSAHMFEFTSSGERILYTARLTLFLTLKCETGITFSGFCLG